MAHKEMMFDELKADSTYGKNLAAGTASIEVLMYPVAVDTEAAYEAALQAGRGAPGNDSDIITDGALTSSIGAHWPFDEPETEPEA